MNFEKIWQENLTELFISLVRCSHFTLKNPKSHFQHYYSYILLIIYLRRKQTVIYLSTPPENVTTLTCKLLNFFIWLNVCCVLSNVGGSKANQLWVVVGGSEESRLWCVATGMSGKQCHSKCSVWPPSATFCVNRCFQSFSTLFGRIVHHAVLKFSPCRNKPLPQASTCQYTRSSYCVPQTQY